MKIVFVSNFYNHHQKYLSDALARELNSNFCFVATSCMPQEQVKLGYSQFEDIPYLINAYENEAKRSAALSAIHNCDIVIFGSLDNNVIPLSAFEGKVQIRYAERQLKKGLEPLKFIPRWIKWHLQMRNKRCCYLLCASAFAAADFAKFGLYRNRTLKWGYFPESKKQEIKELFGQKKTSTIVWCGRMLDWKHPDDAVRVAARLKEDGIQFDLNIIGTGEMMETLRQMIVEHSLEDCVHLFGAKSSDVVRNYMEKAGIYLFTSDRYEGWGAVLNESMNSGCAVVASHAIGAVPYLMKNNENGLVYHSGNVDELYEKVKYLLDNPCEQERLGKAAYETIISEWNAEVAAERLINLSEHLLAGEKYPDLYQTGPCSRAEIIKDDWF